MRPGQTRIVMCPACRGPGVYAADNRYRPFCSARCKGLDFGAWASEGYRVDAHPPSPAGGPADDPDEG